MNIQTIHTKNLRWINVTNPGREEMNWLRANFKFHHLHFHTIAEHQQRPHIDQGTGYDFIVLLFPVYNRMTQEIVPGEIDLVAGDGFLLTIHYDDIHTLKGLFEKTQSEPDVREANMSRGSGFLLYRVLENLFRRSYPLLDHINEDLEKLEAEIFHERNLNILSKIALMKKNVIEYRKMMKTHRFVLEKLPRRKTSYLSFPQSKLYYKDLLEYSQNIWDILEALKETADTLQETSQALTAHRLQEITKMISIFSAILLPATLIAFTFGIGVEGIPFRHHPYGFWLVAGLMILSSLGLLLIFRKKKWF